MSRHNNHNHTIHRIVQSQRRYTTLLGHQPAYGSSRRRGPSTHHRDPVPAPGLTAESQRQAEWEQELQLARDIQQGLLLAAVPHLPGWELSAVSLPARDLGGDLYDFLPLRNGWQGIMIGDVAGKGLPAALQMAVTRTVFRHEARCGNTSSSTLAAVNQGVLNEIPQGMVTMLYALLEPLQGLLRIANAGHTFPLLVNGAVQELEIPGLPLGIDLDIEYDEISITLNPGDTIVFYTDGVTEAFNLDYEMFGLERLQELLLHNRRMKPRALMTLLLHELRAWGISTAQSDDVTIVVLRRRLARLGDEMQTIVEDVLGPERVMPFWAIVGDELGHTDFQHVPNDQWSELLLALARVVQTHFGRGLARELHQQLRLVFEEYR